MDDPTRVIPTATTALVPAGAARVDSTSLNTDDILLDAQPGDATRLRQEMVIFMNGGNVVHHSGPTISSPNSVSVNAQVSYPNLGENNPEFKVRMDFVKFLNEKGLYNEFNKYRIMQNEVNIENGTLRITKPVVEVNNSAESAESNQNVPPISWKSVVQRNIPKADFIDVTPNVQLNGDGTASINPSREFLINARKIWNTSCIGHFVGGSFDFKFIKEQVMKLWKKKGLTSVYYNSKGFYTFNFKTEEEMACVLNLKSVVIGGKRMYLGPWIEGTNFQKNVIPTVQVWTKFSNVPHSYWTVEGLGMIARAVGNPIRMDNLTEKLEPMKFAGILVEISYDSPRPNVIWVPVLNDVDGSIVKVPVEVTYSSLPFSCSICRAFGHSLARCPNNPENVKAQANSQPETSKAASKRQKKGNQQHSTGYESEENSVLPRADSNPNQVIILKDVEGKNTDEYSAEELQMVIDLASEIQNLAESLQVIEVQQEIEKGKAKVDSTNQFNVLSELNDEETEAMQEDIQGASEPIGPVSTVKQPVMVSGLAAGGLPPLHPQPREEGECSPGYNSGKNKQKRNNAKAKNKNFSPSKKGRMESLPKRSPRLQGDVAKKPF